MSIEQHIQETASTILNVPVTEVKVIEKLLGGMSHLTYKIEVSGVYYTIRLIGPGGNLYVDRKEEWGNIQRIKPLHLNNETVYFDTVSGTKIAKYVEGIVLTNTHIYDHLSIISTTLKKLHHSGLKAVKSYGFMERLDKYEKPLDEIDDSYRFLKKAWYDLYESTYKVFPEVFCHNDAQRSNMVLTEEKMYLLDWEYAAMNDVYYDIASFGNVSLEDSFMLLETYLGRKATKDEINHVRFYRMYQGLQWYLVAKYKAILGLGEILHLDFNQLANKYLALAKRLFEEMSE